MDSREALARAEAAARSFMEHTPLGVLVYRGDRVLFGNTRLCRLLGWDDASMVDAPLASLVRPEETPDLLALADAPELPREIPLVRRDGALAWVEAAGTGWTTTASPQCW